MLDQSTLQAVVQRNCHISDARYAGQHTLCIFLLKMREYYRWESDRSYTESIPQQEMGDWLTAREALWDEVEEQPYAELAIGGVSFDPFDSDAINHQLLPHGLVYSAGYGQWNKPHFVLAELREQRDQQGFRIHLAGHELARDLVAPPAMTLGDTILIRRESLRRMLWERVEEWQWHGRGNKPAAIDSYDFDRDPVAALERMTDNETHSVMLHELGEAQVGRLIGPEWSQMLAGLPRSRAEMLARAVRDHWSDCLVTLPTLLREDNRASLHFYIANLKALRKELFPSLIDAYRQWREDGDHRGLVAVVQTGAAHWQRAVEAMLTEYRDAPNDYRERIEALTPSLTL